ncbi:hypothetical protein [Piscinibacter sp. HJYY11]|uniref:hypothetical protein n=1 Tax=Piscinibacter sp. HJYY11 TaxID=2801333 RepID=UPI00191F9B90|nr:hypothetical protein [Piscinibacter sp. HJYY11]MBL0727193.1 hypothetical protein [Piscinibacter sp. HJYY11]
MKSTDHKPDSIAAADKRAQEDKARPEAKSDTPSTAKQLASHPMGAMAGAAAGAAAGVVTGIAAGPVGSLAGAVVGGATGAVLGSQTASAQSGQPLPPGAADGEAEAAAPSIQPPTARAKKSAP